MRLAILCARSRFHDTPAFQVNFIPTQTENFAPSLTGKDQQTEHRPPNLTGFKGGFPDLPYFANTQDALSGFFLYGFCHSGPDIFGDVAPNPWLV